MTFEEWWAKQTVAFDPEEIGLMQIARVTWHASQDLEREACAKVCETVNAARRSAGMTSGYNAIMQCAEAIRERSNAQGEPRS